MTTQTAAKQFKDFGIKSESKSFVGNKIELFKVLNEEITVHEFKIKDSKYDKENAAGKCLHLQIEYNGEKRVLFTGSVVMMDMIQQVEKDDFPFTTKITKDNGRYLFT